MSDKSLRFESLLESQAKSSKSIESFCRDNNVTSGQFHYWKQKLTSKLNNDQFHYWKQKQKLASKLSNDQFHYWKQKLASKLSNDQSKELISKPLKLVPLTIADNIDVKEYPRRSYIPQWCYPKIRTVTTQKRAYLIYYPFRLSPCFR